MKKKEKTQLIGIALFILLIYISLNQESFKTQFNITINDTGSEESTGGGTGSGGGGGSIISGCEEYNLGQVYRDIYGDLIINQAETSCENYGVYYETYSTSGCGFDGESFDVNCDAPQFVEFRRTCEDYLEATWVCDNTNGFVGCVCGSDIPELECWWAEVGSVSYTTLANGYVDWLEVLPKGDYKFTWLMHDYLQNIQIIKNKASIERFTNQGEGQYIFEELTGTNEWGIAVENPHDVQVTTDLKLFQWICEDDPLNWQSDMFDSPNMESGNEPIIECQTDDDCGPNMLCCEYLSGNKLCKYPTIQGTCPEEEQ